MNGVYRTRRRSKGELVCRLCLGGLFCLVTTPAWSISDRLNDWLTEEAKFGVEGFRWGGMEWHPRLIGSAIYSDNLWYSSTDRQKDLIWIVSPGIGLGAGNFLLEADKFIKVDYAPSFLFYQDHTEYNTIDHDARVSAAWDFNQVRVSLQQDVEKTSGAFLENSIGGPIEWTYYGTVASVQLPLTGKTRLELIGRQTINVYDDPGLIDNGEWALHSFVEYQYSPKLWVGPGVGVGFRDVDVGPTQLFEQFLLRARYALSWKTDLHVTAGAEVAQYESGEDNLGPVVNLGASWRPFDGTTVALDGLIQDTASSYLVAQNYTVYGFNTSLRQRFLRKMFFTVGGGYENRSYHSIIRDEPATSEREDRYFYARFNWDWQVTKHWILGVMYMRRDNASNVQPFENNLVGVQSALTF